MSALTPGELALLKAAQAKIDQRREWQAHERLRGRGRPDVPLHVFEEGRAAAAAGAAVRRTQLDVAFHPRSTVEERRAAARAAVDALPLQLANYSMGRGGGLRRRRATAVYDVARELLTALERGHRGHRGPRGNAASFVQQEDLEDLIPDGWGARWPAACDQLARHHGLPPKCFPLLTILTWCRALGVKEAGLQASIEWLARKVGCSESWVKQCLNRLDCHAEWRRELEQVQRANRKRARDGVKLLREPPKPPGVPLARRFRQLKRYSSQRQRDGRQDVFWIDAGGSPRQYYDQRGVTYITAAGCNVLFRRPTAEMRNPRRSNALWRELRVLCRRMQWRVSARLRRAENPVRSSPEKSTAPPRRRVSFGQRVAT